MTHKQEKATDTRATERPNRVLTTVEAMRGEVAALQSELQQVKDSHLDMKNKQPARWTNNKGRNSSPECHHLKGNLVNHVKLVARKEAVITAASVVVGNTTTVDVNTSFRKMPRVYRHGVDVSLRSENVPPFMQLLSEARK